VDALATGAQTRYGDWKPPAAATKLWLGEGVGVSLEAGATVQDAATAINATGKLVYAGVVEGRLVLTSRQTGGGVAAPELREGGDWATGTPWTADRTIRGTNADITVGGVRDQTRTTNDFWLVDQGLHVTLKAPTTTDVTLSATAPAVDKTKIKDKLKAFVTAYNAVVDVVNAKTTEKPVKAPTTAGEAAKGVFFGDTGLLGLMTTLRRQVTERLAGVDDPATAGVSEPDELLDIGISTGKGTGGASSADAKLGKLTIDDAKLDAALADPMAVKALFAGRGAAKGFVERFEATIDGFASTTGMLSSRIAADDGKLRDISSQVARTNARISATETRLKQQFAAMESALGSAQSQQQWLSGQLAALSR
jgi:flagellar hook-associated protein 2